MIESANRGFWRTFNPSRAFGFLALINTLFVGIALNSGNPWISVIFFPVLAFVLFGWWKTSDPETEDRWLR